MPRIPSVRPIPRLVAALLLSSLGPAIVAAQPPPAPGAPDVALRTLPSPDYYAALALMNDGDLREASRGFESALRRAVRTPESRWLDSIPPLVMMAECAYQLGDLGGAHLRFDAALQLFIENELWMAAVQWPQRVQASGAASGRAVPWWNSPRQGGVGQIPRRLPISMRSLPPRADGRRPAALDVEALDATEVLRTLAIALYRRADLLGPLAAGEPLLHQTLAALNRQRGIRPGWQAALYDGVLAAGALADGRRDEAAPIAQRAVQLPGNLDHPLTPVVLLSLARLRQSAGDHEAAVRLSLEAGASAQRQEQSAWIAEAFRVAVGSADDVADDLLLPPLLTSAAAPRTSRWVAAHNHAAAGEVAAAAGRGGDAFGHLGESVTILSRSDVLLPRVAAYVGFAQARALAATGDPEGAHEAVERALQFARGTGEGNIASPRAYQRSLLRSAAAAGAVGGATAQQLFARLLGPASASDWRSDPVDALAASSTDQTELRRLWMANLTEGQRSQLPEQIDALLRERFRRSTPLGGRPLDVRWLLASDPDDLSGEAARLRRELPGRLEVIHRLHLESEALRGDLAQRPLQPAAPNRRQNDPSPVDQLREDAIVAERLALETALSRRTLPPVFPPVWSDSDREQLQAHEAIVCFLVIDERWVGVQLTSEGTTTWDVGAAGQITPALQRLLQEIGVGPRRAGAAAPTTSDAWRARAAALRRQLLPDAALGEEIQRMVIVPTGPLWYVPFEMLPRADEAGPPLGDQILCSYAPTLGLALASPRDHSLGATVGVVANRFFTPQAPELNRELIEEILEETPGAVRIAGPTALPGQWLSSRVAALVVLAEITAAPPGAATWKWSPLGYDAEEPGGTLADWLAFPWGAPALVMMPGYRAQLSGGDGEELFLTACALHAAGTSALVLSRWPVAGESTATLTRQLLSQREALGTFDAWQRAVQLLRREELNGETEPLLGAPGRGPAVVPGDHPLFWAGYMLLQGLR